MRFKSLFFIALVGSFGSFGQVRSQKGRIAEIRNTNPICILTFYEFKGQSSYTLTDTHVLGPSTYVLWIDSSVAWMQKLSYYFDAGNVIDTIYEKVRFDLKEVFQYVTENLEAIQTQDLKPGLVKFETQHGDSLAKVIRKEDDVTIIECFVNQVVIKKVIRGSQLDKGLTLNEDGSIRSRRESINYHFNTNLKLYKLYRLLQAAIVQFESREIVVK